MSEKIEYKVLARKYRPQTFADLIGQETLVQILTNAITTNRIANAYLLTGVRGVGKTTTARLIAKALNCQKKTLMKKLNVLTKFFVQHAKK
jgi:DNA polymerase-3 subunit gamma/tau